MEISPHILSYIKENGSAPVQNFGTFSLQRAGASYSKDSDRLLPPAQQIIFTPNFVEQDNGLIKYIAEKNFIPPAEAARELEKLTVFWKNKILASENVEIKPLGAFYFPESGMYFSGEKIVAGHPDFYGLEEIPIPSLKKKKENPGFLWPAVAASLIIVGIAAFSLLNPELLFGSKSFQNKPKNTEVPAKKIASPATAATLPTADTAKIKDSGKSEPKPVYKPKFHKKSWTNARRHLHH